MSENQIEVPKRENKDLQNINTTIVGENESWALFRILKNIMFLHRWEDFS